MQRFAPSDKLRSGIGHHKNQRDAPNDALQYAITLIVHGLRKCALVKDEDGLLTREYLEVNLAFYGSIILTIWFFWNWLAIFFPHEPPMAAQSHMNMWPFINVLVVTVTSVAGIHLWRKASAQ